MMKKLILIAAALACACTTRRLERDRAEELSRVAKDWCLTIRASQVLPVYPLTEDLQVGDIFLVSTPIEDEVHELQKQGFLPLDNLIARLQPSGYASFYSGGYRVSDTSVVPRQWQFPEPPREAAPLTDWGTAPAAAFPSYTFQVKEGAGATLALPVQSVPVGLSLLSTGSAYGTINITSASTYGLPIIEMSPQVEAWAAKNREFLAMYGPGVEDGKPEQHYVRVVYRVYVAGGVNVSLVADRAAGGNLEAGQSKPVQLFDAGNTTESMNAANNYASVLKTLSQSIASTTPGVALQLSSASSRAVAMNETFPRPLAVGFLAFDRPIEEGGILGPPMPTHARVTGKDLMEANTTTYAADTSSDRIRSWLNADPANRQKLSDYLATRGVAATQIPSVLNAGEYRQLRVDAIAALSIP